MHKPPILGIVAAASDVGKTSYITQLIPLLKAQHIRVSVIKHAHHQFDIDHPGKDSFKIREAGAVQTLIASSQRWALMTETSKTNETNQEADLDQLLTKLDTRYADLVLVEGFKQSNIPKIEVYRPSMDLPLLAEQDKTIIAIATDMPIENNTKQLALNQPQQSCEFIMNWMQNQR